MDYAAFWLHYGLQDEVQATELWMRTMAEEARRYDALLLFPWGALPLVDDGVRSTNRWVQLRFQSILEGLCERHAQPGQLVRVPATPNFPLRVEAVLSALRQMRN